MSAVTVSAVTVLSPGRAGWAGLAVLVPSPAVLHPALSLGVAVSVPLSWELTLRYREFSRDWDENPLQPPPVCSSQSRGFTDTAQFSCARLGFGSELNCPGVCPCHPEIPHLNPASTHGSPNPAHSPPDPISSPALLPEEEGIKPGRAQLAARADLRGCSSLPG